MTWIVVYLFCRLPTYSDCVERPAPAFYSYSQEECEEKRRGEAIWVANQGAIYPKNRPFVSAYCRPNKGSRR